MERVLITGGTGFIGANFVRKFIERGDEVHITIRKDSNLWRINDIQKKIFMHIADITDKTAVDDIFKLVNPQIVLHFAAHGAGSAKDRNDVGGTVAINLLGTINLADAFAEFGGRCFINVGSSSEYGKKDHPISEDNVLAPESLYGITKAAATLYCSTLAKQKNLPMVTLRLFSPFGYFEGEGRLMHTIVNAALSSKKFEAPSPHIVRDSLFIDEVVNAFDLAIRNIQKIKGEVINIASGEQHSVAEIVAIVQKITGLKFEVIYGNIPLMQSEPKMWVADISKAKRLLEWQSAHTFEEGLKKYVQWSRGNIGKIN